MINVAVGINQRCLTQANGLDFRSREHDASGISINEKILKRRFFVPNLYGTLFS